MIKLYPLVIFIIVHSIISISANAQQVSSTWADPTGHYSTTVQPDILCGLNLCPVITSPEAVADNTLSNFATISFPALSVLGSASVTVDLPQTVRGSVGGFKIASTTSLSVLSLLPSIEVDLINNNTIVQARIYATLLDLLSFTPGNTVSLCVIPSSSSVQYNKVRLTINVPVGVNAALGFQLYNAYANPTQPCTAQGVLPVLLSNFQASAESDCDVRLKWSTVTEHNTSRFEISRREENSDAWQTLGKVTAKGESNTENHYEFTDRNTAANKYLYRINSIDHDGKSTYYYSSLVRLACVNDRVSIFPTVVDDEINIRLPASMVNSKIQLLNASGQQQLLSKSGAGQNRVLSLKHLPAGMYILRVMSSSRVETAQIMVK